MGTERMNAEEQQTLRERVNALPWFHQIDFGNGIVSPGRIAIETLRKQADVYFRGGIAGKSVLDIGCWDGYNSIEAMCRGASRVLATDHFAWSDGCWGKREAFELARAHLAPAIEVMDSVIHDLTTGRIGTFDIVLFAGVLYHVRNPLRVLTSLAPLAKEVFIVETHLDARWVRRPAMIFYPGREQDNDPTNWWGPNAACVEAMLRDVGFAEVRHTPNPAARRRGIFHATR
jgi:tRNA (mo5U34)-methyltransferase